jgi:hypothetical protein
MIHARLRPLPGLVLAAVLWAGVAAGAEKIKVQLAPNLAAYNVDKVAILGLANTSGDTEAEKMASHLRQAIYGTNKFHFSNAEQFALDAKRTGVQTEYDRLRNTWLKKRIMEPAIVKKVLDATHYDAVVGVEVSRWEKRTIDPMQEGTSDTIVGLLVRMVAADGTILWSASETRTAESEPYLPNLKSTEGGQAVATGNVPQPPDINKVAGDLARDVVATMPAIKNAASPAKAVVPPSPAETPPAAAPKDTSARADSSGSKN